MGQRRGGKGGEWGKRSPDLPDLPEGEGNQRAGLPRAGGLRAGIEGRASAGPAGADRRRGGWHGAAPHPARASVDSIRVYSGCGRDMAGEGGPREKCAPGVPPEKMCPKRDVWKGANPLKNGADSGN